ncbi:MAG: ChuX/HutX family heme-like substrate-binding protein [Flavipsychrobacter sp.]|nr:ChuX/HutX family heme-like substrate-binding protein [Flavipsychrobacter sp.]
MEITTTSIRERFEQAKINNPKTRIRDIATQLHTSEAVLVALSTENILLEGDFKELLKEVHTMGHVMALTRNNDAVHERKGVYNNVSFEGHMGLVLDPDIDLRLFMMHWKFGFAVQEGDRKSLQFFDKSGEAVHKIYLTEKSDVAVWHTIANKYKAALQETDLVTTIYAPAEAEIPDIEIDAEAFQQDWLQLKDTHEFFGLLRKYKLKRTQALRMAPVGFVKEIPEDTTRKMLLAASEQQVSIMVFVANRGCIQIHTGTVDNLLETGPWFNVLDPEFNLHLRESSIKQSFIVRKPSVDGIVTSLEVFDEEGEMIVQFFGKRKPGNPELESWTALIDQIAGW